MTATYTPRRGDVVTCDDMATHHKVWAECRRPVLVQRPEPLAPFARRVMDAKARSVRYVAVRS